MLGIFTKRKSLKTLMYQRFKAYDKDGLDKSRTCPPPCRGKTNQIVFGTNYLSLENC